MTAAANPDVLFQHRYYEMNHQPLRKRVKERKLESLAILTTKKKRVTRIIQQLRNDLKAQCAKEYLLSNTSIRLLTEHFYDASTDTLPWEEVIYQTLVKIRVAAREAQVKHHAFSLGPIRENFFLDRSTTITPHQAERFATLSIDYLYQLTSCASLWSN